MMYVLELSAEFFFSEPLLW